MYLNVFLRYLKYTSYRLNINNNELPYKRDRTASLKKKRKNMDLYGLEVVLTPL